MSWFEFRHALSDLRHRRGWYGTYAYARKWTWANRLEWWLRERHCKKHGHLFPGGGHGEHAWTTWKHFCVICRADAPYEWRTP